jgi:hypothetical protein
VSDPKKPDPHAWDFTPIAYSPDDLDYKKVRTDTETALVNSMGIPPSAYGTGSVSAVASLMEANEAYFAKLLAAYRSRPKWPCGFPGCKHATAEGAMFHVYAMLYGMPSIVTRSFSK